MQPYEEYLKRNEMGTSVVHHIKRGALFLKLPTPSKQNTPKPSPKKKMDSSGGFWIPDGRRRVSNSTRWLILSVEWNHEPQYHPGKYYINAMAPRHDSASRRHCSFDGIAERDVVHYDEWENYWANWVKKIDKGTVVHGKNESVVTAWEMFVYCHDSFFSKRTYEDKLFRSIDPQLSIEDRIGAINDITNLMRSRDRDSEALSRWQHDFEMTYLQTYLHWLADLVVRDDAEKTILTGSGC